MKPTSLRFVVFFFVFFNCSLLIVNCPLLIASVPQQMTYQSKVTDVAGVGITDTLDIAFSFWNSDVDGDSLWGETQLAVPIIKGLFAVQLGLVNPITLSFDTTYWLQIIVDGDLLLPRTQLTTCPYAYRAMYADSMLGGVNSDTIWSADKDPADTIVVMAQAKVFGELIADSIQSVGDDVAIDDNLDIYGCASVKSHLQTMVYSESFESGDPPTGWEEADIIGIADLAYVTNSSFPGGYLPTDGNKMLRFGSYNYPPNDAITLIQTVGFATTGYNSLTLYFDLLRSVGFPSHDDRFILRYSTNGVDWTDAVTYRRYDGTAGWSAESYVLPSALADQPQVFFAFRFISDHGENIHIDNLTVMGTTIDIVDNVTLCDGNITTLRDVDADGDIEASSFTLGGRTIYAWENLKNFDTLWSKDAEISDTIVVMANTKVYGELITDSIQAVGDDIVIDDNLDVYGCASFKGMWQGALYSESFESVDPPVGWEETGATGSAALAYVTTSSSPSGYDPTHRLRMVRFNSNYCAVSEEITLRQTISFSSIGYNSIQVELDMLHDTGAPGNDDVVILQYSINGAVWVPKDTLHRYDGTTGWNTEIVALPDSLADRDTIFLAFRFISDYGNNIHIDNLVVRGSTISFTEMANICDGSIYANSLTLEGVTINSWEDVIKALWKQEARKVYLYDPSAFVGIGTMNPQAKLDVQNETPAGVNNGNIEVYHNSREHDIHGSALVAISNNTGTSTYDHLYCSARLGFWGWSPDGAKAEVGVWGHTHIGGLYDSYGVIGTHGDDPLNPTKWAYLAGENYAGYFSDDVKIDSSLYVLSKVGIGTINPEADLDVIGKIRTANFQMITDSTAGFILKSDSTGNASWVDPTTVTTAADGDWTISGSNIYSTVSGNVGIGVTNPSAKIHTHSGGITGELPAIMPDSLKGLLSTWNGNYLFSGLRYSTTGPDAVLIWGDDNASKLRIGRYDWTTNLLYDRMTIAGNGNVGIGVSSPGKILDVSDRMRVRQGGDGSAGIWLYQTTPALDQGYMGMFSDTTLGFWGRDGAGQGLIMKTTSGNVGVGTTNPQQKLDVQGNAIVEGGLNWGGISTGTGTNYAITINGIDSNVAGLIVVFQANIINTVTTPTVSINGMATQSLFNANGAIIGIGNIANGAVLMIVYDGVDFHWVK